MKLTKHQKAIVKKINDGSVYDLYSFASEFGILKSIKYDISKVQNNFNQSLIPKSYYYPSYTSKKNIIDEIEFNKGVETGTYSHTNYNNCKLKVSYKTGIKTINISNKNINLNFYTGIDIINDFDEILEFCMVWQYLKEEMLIMECSHDINEKTIGLFCFQKEDIEQLPVDICNSYKKYIDFDDFGIDDKYFINEEIYILSKNSLEICKDFIGKKIIKTHKLNLFIKKNFKTYEEHSQTVSMILAIIAIITSIIIAALTPIYNDFIDNKNHTFCEPTTSQNNLVDFNYSNNKQYSIQQR